MYKDTTYPSLNEYKKHYAKLQGKMSNRNYAVYLRRHHYTYTFSVNSKLSHYHPSTLRGSCVVSILPPTNSFADTDTISTPRDHAMRTRGCKVSSGNDVDAAGGGSIS